MSRRQKVAVVVGMLLALTACGGQDDPPDPRMALVGTYTQSVADGAERLLTKDRDILENWVAALRQTSGWDGDYEALAWDTAEDSHKSEHMVLTLNADGTVTLEVRGVTEGVEHSKVLHGTWMVGDEGPVLDITHVTRLGSDAKEPFELHAPLRHEDGVLTHETLRDPLRRVE